MVTLDRRRVATCYQHEQTTDAITWTVQHMMGHYPIVDVYTLQGGELQKTIPLSIVYVDADTCEINFSFAVQGFATLM